VLGRQVLILAIGADSIGKQELSTCLVASASLLVVDSRVQCSERGESQHALKSGLIDFVCPGGGVADRMGRGEPAERAQESGHGPLVCEIGECCVKGGSAWSACAGVLSGDSWLVVFDSTGVAVQDVAIAELAMGELRRGRGLKSRL